MKLGHDRIQDFTLEVKANHKIAIIQSLFNYEITDGLVKGAESTLRELNFEDNNIKIIKVSGAVEIPLVAKVLAKKKKYMGIIALGAVIKGETPHFDYVCQMVSSSLMDLSLEFEVPLGFGVLTTNTLEQAQSRASQDDYNKGRESALAVIRQLQAIERIHQNR